MIIINRRSYLFFWSLIFSFFSSGLPFFKISAISLAFSSIIVLDAILLLSSVAFI
jgi:hypothetical protein